VQGQRIQSITEWGSLGMGFFPAVHYGRRGAVLVIGLDRERVAEGLITGGKKEGLLGETNVAAAIKETDEKAVVVGVLSSARAAMDLFAVMSRPPVVMRAPAAPGQVPAAPVERPPEKPLDSSKAGQAFLKTAEPLVFALNRQSDRLMLEIRPLPLRRMTPRLLDVWIEALLQPVGAVSSAGFGGKSDAIVLKK
ncbi:MAG: hypothetical protein ACRELG_21550, partial [Gemmataceae bacterium]